MNNILTNIEEFYNKHKSNLFLSLEEYYKQFENDIKYNIKRDAFINVLLKTLKEKYPNYIIINEGVPDDHSSIGIGIFNIPDEVLNREYKSNFRSIEDECYNLVTDTFNDEFDVLFFCRNVSTTKEHYQYRIDRYNKENNKNEEL